MKAYLKDAAAYLWSGWGPVSSVLLFVALWEFGHQVYGTLILPSPIQTMQAFVQIYDEGVMLPAAMITAKRAMFGFFVAIGVGSVLGIAAGLSMTASRAMRPIVTIALGVPPITWVVLALMWFGMGGGSAVFTVVVTTLPITFAGAMMGTRTLDNGLHDMARTYHTPFLMMLWDVYLPHVLSYLFPAWITGRIAMDTPGTLALLVCVLGMLMAVEYLLLEPIQRQLEPWRNTDGPANFNTPKGF
ncbi:MAG: ABC transporter permease [Rhodobacterales bacterium]|nr:MAG: ABC transporter permease [Rhodobacterales bacterium]